MRQRLWPHLRAVLVAAHLIAMALAAVPTPGPGMNRLAWRQPAVQAEFEVWAARLGVSKAAFEEWLWDAGRAWATAHHAVVAPITPYQRATGTLQNWRMFSAPNRFPALLRIERSEGTGWRPVYETRSPEHRWRAATFEHERFRSGIFRLSWPQYTHEFRSFCRWAAGEILAEHPGSDAVRCRYWRYRSPTPAEAKRGETPPGSWGSQFLVTRAELSR